MEKHIIPLRDMTLGGLLRQSALQFPDRPALEYDGQVWSYRELDGQVDAQARCLLARGVKKGDHVALWCESTPQALFALYALLRIGAVTALMNTSLGRSELKVLLRESDAAFLLIGAGYKGASYPALCAGLTGELPQLKGVLCLEGGEGGIPALTEGPMADRETLDRAAAAVSPRDTALILYTSGTASTPKAVLGSHYSRVNSGIQQAHDLGATERDRFCTAMPMFHCFCLSANVFAACAVGGCLYLPVDRRTHTLLAAVQEGKCTILSCVPTLYRAILRREDFSAWDLSSLRVGIVGGSLCPPEQFREIDAAFGGQFTLLSSLGQTEATAGLTVSGLEDDLEVRSTTVGHFMNHVEGRIAHPVTGETLPIGEPGEICVRGYLVMEGYYARPEETAKAIDREGWLHTGDMGWLDQAGNVHLTGRLKEIIIRGGENISPAEIDVIAARDPRIAQCQTVGVPDPHYGEELCLCAVCRPGETLPEAELRRTLAGQLAAFKVPRYILFLPELPRTSSGKVRLSDLRAMAREALGLSQGPEGQ